MPLFNKFKKIAARHNLIKRHDRLVIGLSGGADSVALTLLLNALRKEFALHLHIAHLNHGLRGDDSRKDAAFVAQLAQKLNLPAAFREINLTRLKQDGSPEEIARKARLDFLFEVAKDCHAEKIALGHNLDDQAETVLMRLIRGSGLLGLSGILPKRRLGNFIIIRPLLEISREEIECFIRAKRIKARRDYTNCQEIYFRNLIRRRLIPRLSQYNPNIKGVLASAAENFAIDYEYLSREGLRAFRRLRRGRAESKIKLPLAQFLRLHAAMRHMVLRFSYEALKGDMRRLSFQHIRELEDLASGRPLGSIVDLPSRISVIKNPQALCVYMRP